MRYSELLEKLRKQGVDEVSRMLQEKAASVLLSRPEYVVFPHIHGPVYPMYLGEDQDRELHEEEVKAICRRFRIDALALLEEQRRGGSEVKGNQ
jgi:hypothetical protein